MANHPAPHLLDPDRVPPVGEAPVVGSLADRVRALRLPSDEEMHSRGSVRRAVGYIVMLAVAATLLSGAYYVWKNGVSTLFDTVVETNDTPGAISTKAEPTVPVGTKTTVPPPLAKSTSSTAAVPASITSSRRAIPVASSGGVALEAKGYIIPAHQILVSPLVSGRIMALSIEEGRRVEKGAILAELETTEYEADLSRAKAILAASRSRLEELESGNRPEEVAGAKAELAEAEAQRQQLYGDWKRKTQLRESRVLTENEYELAESQFKAMDRRVEKLRNNHKLMEDGPRVERIDIAKAEVQQAEAEVKRAQWRYDNCTIRAPISGTILKKNAEEGNIVNPIAFNGSFSLCEMADLSDLEVELSIQERDIARVKQGQLCQVRAEAYSDRVYDGVVSRLMPIADRAKGAIPVRVKLTVPSEEEGIYLKPEMGAIVSFLKTEDGPAR